MPQALLERSDPGTFSPAQRRVLDISMVVGATVLMAVCAHVSIPLWFTPVPITLQTFGVMFLALSLGGWRAAAALTLYIFEGMSGLPVFSPHGPGGTAHLFGPTGGYLMAYPFAALAGGLIADKFLRKSRTLSFSLGAIACDALILAAGALWLLLLTHKPSSAIMTVAVLPFLPGEVLKGSAAVSAALGLKQLAAK